MASVKKLINDANDVVTECIEGLVETYPGLQYLDGFPEVKVVIRADVSRGTYDKVALLSGGGSGHEPAHAGYVGPGMLTAAVCGDVFASPSVNAILAGIRSVTGPKGCLLIVKNYTGDRLNFGLAAEQAKAEGFKVEMVIVGDDCAIQTPRGVAGRRGLAGTIFVHKVAGAAADAGLNLDEVKAEAKRVAQLVGTMGVALSVCTLPGQGPSDRLGPGKMELGLGIHGEPGAAMADIQPVDVVVSHVLKRILSAECIPVKRGSRVALMVNGLGATPLMELMIAAGKAVAQLQLDYGVAVARVYTGCFMTALDMAGMSISILKVDDTILPRLDAPTKAPSWPVGVSGPRPPTTIPVPLPPAPANNETTASRPPELTGPGKLLEAAIEAGAEAIIKIKDSLNDWDSKVGDGDCGTTMWKGANAVLEDLRKCYPLNDTAATINELGGTIRRVMGGTSGVLYDIFSKAAYVKLKDNADQPLTAKCWSDALDAAVTAVSTYGGASAGHRTMLDALLPAAAVLREKVDAGEDPVKAFVAAAEAAQAGAESTKDMQAQAGRSSYISPDLLTAVPDPGAMAVAAWFGAAADAVSLNAAVAT
ncbi:hypothetical protein SELMODRAFT_271610 [Selaginella moellendorffii]|uniref:3,4-dihydroxy-2-butanone kinase n=1 Tax=Selaginella moellendorffii TaxID=88036 RepID=D8SIL0_SELML|nr:putative 3,4-dihydroxy-2-butanone kinase [Selaginella moellendorffii]EFJ15518.1 hypothetical protein SELMODRAFT_271610 [Selaginella moellendorffii]|eukprot:XP_002983176.1 putative 3,4-dihydroxy-2-butanone kinase [Selaginella moellendorffii]